MITRASVQGWDNSSRGLDASTALEYVQSIRTLTNMAHTSTAVSLYQAGESLYGLVDKVLLIHEGKCLYFGLAENAKQYFINLGFECKPRWTTADFLTSVTDPYERAVRKGWEDRIPRNADEFASLYRESDAYKHNLDDITEFETHLGEQRKIREESTSKKNQKKNYAIPFHKQVLACTHRQFLVLLGDRASLFGKWGGLVFQVCRRICFLLNVDDADDRPRDSLSEACSSRCPRRQLEPFREVALSSSSFSSMPCLRWPK